MTDLTPQPRREIPVMQARAEYHEEWGVRKYDLRHLREDLDHMPSARHWLSVVASVAAGTSVTAFTAAIAGLASHPLAPLPLRVGYFVASAIFAIISVAMFVVDRGDETRENVSLGHVQTRLDELIAMFPEDAAKRHLSTGTSDPGHIATR